MKGESLFTREKRENLGRRLFNSDLLMLPYDGDMRQRWLLAASQLLLHSHIHLALLRRRDELRSTSTYTKSSVRTIPMKEVPSAIFLLLTRSCDGSDCVLGDVGTDAKRKDSERLCRLRDELQALLKTAN